MPKSLEVNCSQRFTCSKHLRHGTVQKVLAYSGPFSSAGTGISASARNARIRSRASPRDACSLFTLFHSLYSLHTRLCQSTAFCFTKAESTIDKFPLSPLLTSSGSGSSAAAIVNTRIASATSCSARWAVPWALPSKGCLPHCFLCAGQLAFRHPWSQKQALLQRQHALRLTPGVLQPLHTFFQIGRFQDDRFVCVLDAHNEPAAAALLRPPPRHTAHCTAGMPAYRRGTDRTAVGLRLRRYEKKSFRLFKISILVQ
jgi:hypothetical protein